MTRIPAKPLLLALALSGAVAGLAVAQTAAPTPAQQKELDAARADLERAARRMAELSRAYGDDGDKVRIERRMLRKPVIGVLLAPDAQAGVRIAGVTPDSAASAAGLRSGDRLLAIDGKPIPGDDGEARVEGARSLLGALEADRKVTLRYARDGREASVAVAPKVADRLLFIPEGMDEPGGLDRVRIIELEGAAREAAREARGAAVVARRHAELAKADAQRHAQWAAAVAPEIRREIIRLGPGGDCKGEHCKVPMLAEALRWNGLNLASLDADLGRYFGATSGVLVLSTSPELAGLRAGDVIRSVDGKQVATPREVMAALRAKPADAKATIGYLRERKEATTEVTVPKALPLRVPAPPAPPAPPAAPPAPPSPLGAITAPAPPAPPAPPPPPPAPPIF